MKTVWIIGAGRFGALALERLSAMMADAQFSVIDSDDSRLVQISVPEPKRISENGVAFLAEHLHPESAPDWIIPAVPVHLAAEWCLAKLSPERAQRIDIPSEILSSLPNPMRGTGGDVYASHATFICPDECPEPAQICTATGEPRKPNLFDILRNTRFPGFHSEVIRSRQLGPGVGGYRPWQLFDLLDRIQDMQGDILVSTSCRCHCVLTGMKRL